MTRWTSIDSKRVRCCSSSSGLGPSGQRGRSGRGAKRFTACSFSGCRRWHSSPSRLHRGEALHSMRPKNNYRRCPCLLLLLVCVVFLSCDLSLGQQANGTDLPPDAPKPDAAQAKGFFARWAEFYRQDWSKTSASSPDASSSTPERRGLPSPLDSPPFPNSDWSYGG